MKDVFVFGSINMDMVAFCDRHPRVGETVIGSRARFFPGGKGANQAIAAARCAGKSFLIGSVGADWFGEQLIAHLKASGVDVGLVSIEQRVTGVAVIVVDAQGNNTIVVTPGANELAKAPARLPDAIGRPAIALAQLETPLAEIAGFFRQVRAAGGATILNPSPYRELPEALLQVTSLMVLNAHEFGQLLGKAASENPADVLSALGSAEGALPCCVITLGRAGFILAEHGRAPFHVPGHAVTPVDATGAGDCFAGWFAAELAAGHSLEAAARRANGAAAICVTRPGAGASMPTKIEVDDLLKS